MAAIASLTATVLIQVGADDPKPIGTIEIPIQFSTGTVTVPLPDFRQSNLDAVRENIDGLKVGRAAHFLTEDHNGEPVCHCGWDPARDLDATPQTREVARSDIRQHVAAYK